MIPLLPCPFCGSPGRIVEWSTGVPRTSLFDPPEISFSVECSNCSCHLFAEGDASTESEAAAAWNHRFASRNEGPDYSPDAE